MGNDNSTESENFAAATNARKGGLSAFCCNNSLCNNDANVDNTKTQVNRRYNQFRGSTNNQGGMHRTSDMY